MVAVEKRAKAENKKKTVKENIPQVPEMTMKAEIRQCTVKYKPAL